LGEKIIVGLISHLTFGAGLVGVLFSAVLELTIDHLKRRIMKTEVKTIIKKTLSGIWSGSMQGAPHRVVK